MALNAAELQIIITADASQAQAEMNNVEGMISGVLVGNSIKNFGEDALGFVGDFISVGATFEEQMTLIDRIIGGTVSHMDELKQKAIDADIRTMFDAMEVTKGMEMLARSGFNALQIIGDPGKNNGLIDAVLNFAGATKESTEVAGRSFAAVARIFQNSGISMIELSDLLTAAVLRSGKSASEFMTAFQYVGSISQQFGTTPDDIATVIALMQQLGIRSMTVGQSLRSMYTAFATDRGTIEGLGVSLYTVNDAGEEVLRTLPDIIQQFHTLVKSMSPAAALDMMTDIFGKPAASALMTLFTTGAENLDDFTASMNDASDAQGIMDARMNTLRGSLEKFSATWLGLKKVLGDSVSGFVKPIIDGATYLVNLLQNAPPIVLQATAALIALAGALAWLGGSMILISALTRGRGLGWLIGESFSMALPAILPFAAGLLVLGGAALLVKNNFGGLRDTLTKVQDKWDKFKDLFHDNRVRTNASKLIKGHARQDQVEIEQMYTGTYKTVQAALQALKAVGGPDLLGLWDKIYPHVKEVAEGFGVLGRTYERLSNVIKKHGLAEGLRQLFGGDIGKDLLKGIGDIVSEGPRLLGTFLRNFDTGSKRINGILKNFGSAFQLLGTVIEAALDGEWGKAWDAFGRMVVRSVKGGIALGSVLIDIAGWLFQTGKDLYKELKIWIMGQITGSGDTRGTHRPRGAQAQDTPSLGTVTVAVADWAFKSGVEIVSRFTEWIGGELNKIFPDGNTNPALATGFGRPIDDSRVITIDGIDFKMQPGDVTWDSAVDWMKIASALLGAADKNLTEALGADRSAADVDRSYKAGDEAGRSLAYQFSKGVSDGVDWFINNMKSDDGKGGGEGGDSGPGRAFRIVKKILTYEPIDTSNQHSFFDEWMAYGQGIGEGVHNAIFEGLNNAFYGKTSERRNEMGDGPTGQIVDTTQSYFRNFWDQLLKNLGLGEDGFFTTSLATITTTVSDLWDDLTDALTPDLDFEAPQLPQWMNQDLKWLTGPVDTVVKEIDKQVDRLRRAWNALQFWKNNPDGKEEPFMPEKGSVYDFQIPKAEDYLPGGPNYNVPPAPPGDNKFGNPWDFLGGGGVKLPNLSQSPFNIPKPTLTLNSDIQAETQAAGRTLKSFASSVPMQMDGFKSGMERIANEAMSRFQSALGLGMAGGSRIAAFGAQALAIAAKPRDLYNDGFNVGYRLGQGMAAGMMATIGQVIGARQALELAGSGESAKGNPFGGGSSASSVPTKEPTTITQTNHITMSVGEVEELVTAAHFVGNLTRSRQITLGRA